MDFSAALLALKNDKLLKRKNWKPARFIYLQKDSNNEYSHIKLMMENEKTVPWSPNRCDLLENDWEFY